MEKAIEVSHYHFNYQAVGCSSNPAILFLHGFMGDCHEFDEAIAVLSNHFYCLAVDLPGHGKTQVTEDEQHYTMTNTAHGLIQFLESLRIQQSCLVGYSMGGRLALYLTLHFPNYFLKTVLESASPGLKTQAERDQRILKDLNLAKELEADFPSFLANWYQQPLFTSLRNYPNFGKLLEQRLQNDPSCLARSLCNLSTGRQPSLWKQLHQNLVPIRLLAGELDQKFIGINAEMSQVGKLMQFMIVSQCGHNIHFEDAIAFAEHIQDFLMPAHD
jgi:2-succinyl-6-hydroxy-2,4-cyclohexadiene-1-carboxylate synthase